MTTLATFVQISDLHIGQLDPSNGDAVTNNAVARLAASYPLLDGFVGHHARGMQDLEAFCKGLAASGEPFEIIVTGDYTRCGDSNELKIVQDFLARKVDLQPPYQIMAGLSLGGVPLGVPGNHDHWGGLNGSYSSNPSTFYSSKTCLKPPYVVSGPQIGNRQLTFIGIDTDADVYPNSANRLFAFGHCPSQFTDPKLAGLPPNQGNELRVLVLHHAWHHRGATLQLTRPSRQALEQFCYNKKVQVVLAGHTHSVKFAQLPTQTVCMELCSGSTTQFDYPPPSWRAYKLLPQSRAYVRNSLLLHRIIELNSGGALWTTVVYRRDAARGFVQLPNVTCSFGV